MIAQNPLVLESIISENSSRFYVIARRIAYKLCGRYHDSEDVAQESLLKLWNARENFDSSRNGTNIKAVEKFLYSIVVNSAKDLLRFRNRRMAFSYTYDDTSCDNNFLAVVNDPTCSLNIDERNDYLARRIDELEPTYREVIKLRAKGLKCRDIANNLKIPEGTVKSRLHQAKKQLREIVEKDEMIEFLT